MKGTRYMLIGVACFPRSLSLQVASPSAQTELLCGDWGWGEGVEGVGFRVFSTKNSKS